MRTARARFLSAVRCQADESAVATVSMTKELKMHCLVYAKRELFRQFWKPCPVRAALQSARVSPSRVVGFGRKAAESRVSSDQGASRRGGAHRFLTWKHAFCSPRSVLIGRTCRSQPPNTGISCTSVSATLAAARQLRLLIMVVVTHGIPAREKKAVGIRETCSKGQLFPVRSHAAKKARGFHVSTRTLQLPSRYTLEAGQRRRAPWAQRLSARI